MEAYGGFDHNAQALRIVTRLERRYADYDGLNLTWETLEGLVKHNGPLRDSDGVPATRYAKRGVPAAILEFDERIPLALSGFASAEAQAAAVADDIAYNAHDIDDGLRAGLFELDDLRSIAFIDGLMAEIDALHPGLDQTRRVHELTRRVITRFIEDVIVEARGRLIAAKVGSVDDVRGHGATLVGFSTAMAEVEKQLKTFLFARMYRHPRVVKVRNEAIAVVRNLFVRLLDAPSDMPEEWARRALSAPYDVRRARQVCDYIAGMTDRYALAEHSRLFGAAPSLR